MGHERGYQTVDRIVTAAAELGVRAMTLYTFSAENWRRPQAEIEGIMRLIAQAAREQLAKLLENGVQLRLAGRIHELPDFVRDPLLEDVLSTRDNPGLVLTLAINYGGRAELVDAARRGGAGARRDSGPVRDRGGHPGSLPVSAGPSRT